MNVVLLLDTKKKPRKEPGVRPLMQHWQDVNNESCRINDSTGAGMEMVPVTQTVLDSITHNET